MQEPAIHPVCPDEEVCVVDVVEDKVTKVGIIYSSDPFFV